ncbi:MAG: 1-acyl-sn-glycerol-3-phosphate acyltransferase [Balneolaceae bacterium]|nr:1-acyl-sn-glycerol-3-phosphate acyltransferase [Balneolaceae bacterium]
MKKKAKNISLFQKIRSLAGILVFFLILLLMTPVILFLLIISLGKLSSFIVEKIAPLIAKPVFPVMGLKFREVRHVEPIPYPAVFIINHSSTLDILTILALGLPRVRFVAKWQFQYNPIFLILGRLTGQVFIRREKSDRAIQTLKRAVARLKRDQLSVMLAPEGSRKHPGVIGPFKKGPFRMALDLGYPIVPVYFEGNRELSEGGLLFTHQGELKAHVHPPIDISDWALEDLDKHIASVRALYLEWAGVPVDAQSVPQESPS